MTFLNQLMLYFCTAVCVMYLLSGGYRAVRDFWRRQIDKRAAERISASQSAGEKRGTPFTLVKSPASGAADKLQLTGISKAATYTLLIDSVKVEVNNADIAA
ncbi:DUF1378 family protein [Escherichia coli]|nr:DUF1378 family protein [Escherichia coli]